MTWSYSKLVTAEWFHNTYNISLLRQVSLKAITIATYFLRLGCNSVTFREMMFFYCEGTNVFCN